MTEDSPATYCLACEYDAGSSRAECCPECGGELSPVPPPTPALDKTAILAAVLTTVMLPITCFGGLLMMPPIYGRVTITNVATSFVFLLLTSLGTIRLWRLWQRLEQSDPRNPGAVFASIALTLIVIELFIVLLGTFMIIAN